MYLAIRDGKFWSGYSWGSVPKRYMTTGSCIRSLQEAGEDIDECHVVEDIFNYANEFIAS